MKKLSVIFLLVLACSCGSGPCDEPVSQGFINITFKVVDGGTDVFSTDDAKKSLQVFSLERNKPVDFNFSNSIFRINDSTYDDLAAKDLICPSYILKYGTNNVDTLKVCYQLKRDRCGGSELEDVRVFWNQRVMDYSGPESLATITK